MASKNHHTPTLPESYTEFDEYYRELFETEDGEVYAVKTVDDWLEEYWCTVQLAKYKKRKKESIS